MLRSTLLCIALVSLTVALTAADDWPHWRGPSRNDVVAEDSRHDENAWPPRKVLWEKNVGIGSTSPLVVGRQLYVMGWDSNTDTLRCLDAADGRELWKTSYPAPRYGRNAVGDQGVYMGITSTPEFDADTGLLYTLSIDGELNCWDTRAKGRKVWGGNLYDRYRMRRRPKVNRSGQRDYGYTTAPLVHNDWVLVEVGAEEGTIMAFDKRTGRRQWASEANMQAGHTGGMAPITVEGVPCVAAQTHEGLLVVRLDRGNEGKTVATWPWITEWANNIASPAVHEDCVLITSGYNHVAICKLRITLDGAQEVWQQKECSKVCTPVIHNGHVYWCWRKPVCLDFATGKVLWTGPRDFSDAGSCIVTSDNRLIIYGDRGNLVLAETADRSPDKYQELARTGNHFRTDAWPHVVLADGRVYCKDRKGNLKCLALGGGS